MVFKCGNNQHFDLATRGEKALSDKSASQLVLQFIGVIGMGISSIIFVFYICFMLSDRYHAENVASIILSGITLSSLLAFFISNYLIFCSGRNGKYIVPVRVISVIALFFLTLIPVALYTDYIRNLIPSFPMFTSRNYLWVVAWLVPVVILIALYRVKKQGIKPDRYRVIQRDKIMGTINKNKNSTKSDTALNVFRFIVIILLINVVVNLILKANGASVSSFFFFI